MCLKGLLHYFILKKTAAKSHRILVKVYGEHALLETTCRDWFRHFKRGDFDLSNKDRGKTWISTYFDLCSTDFQNSTSMLTKRSTIGSTNS